MQSPKLWVMSGWVGGFNVTILWASHPLSFYILNFSSSLRLKGDMGKSALLERNLHMESQAGNFVTKLKLFQLCRTQFVQKDRLGDLLGVFPFLVLCFWEYNACHQCLKVIIPMFLSCWWEIRPSEISTHSWHLRDGKLGRENGSKLQDIVMPKWKNNGLPSQNIPSTCKVPERLFWYDFLDSNFLLRVLQVENENDVTNLKIRK